MPKLTPPISVKALRDLKLDEEIADGGCPGLRARLFSTGVNWSVMVVENGKRKRVSLGPWPEIGVPEARALAAKAKAASSAIKSEPAFRLLDEVIDLYGELGDPPEKSWADMEHRTKMVFAPALRQPVTTPEELQKVADAYPARGQASVAVRYLKPILKWAGKRGYAPRGVGLELEQPVKTGVGERVLAGWELKAVLPHLGQHHHDGVLRMILLTACRREEVAAMTVEEIKGDIWRIPGTRRKNGKELLVPITEPMQGLIDAQERKSGRLFIGPKGKPLANWHRYQLKLFQLSGTEGWHRHDLRRTAATLLGDEGVPPAIVEIVLGHKDPHSELAGVYNKSRYLKLHRETLETLSQIVARHENRVGS